MFKDDESVKFLQDPDVTNKLSNCKTLSDVNPSEYDAVFYVGGKVSSSRSAVACTNGDVGAG
jgi:putative intracellular protease/amidase